MRPPEKSGKKTCGGNHAVPPAGLSISFRQVYLYTLSSILSRRRMNREEIQMKRTWRKKIGAVVALLAAVAVLGTGLRRGRRRGCGVPDQGDEGSGPAAV